MYFDPLYILFSLPAFIVSLGATLILKLWTSQYSNKPNSTGVTGLDVVQKVALRYNLNLKIAQADGYLDDHYDPRNKTIALSNEVAHRPTIAAVAITAHELGHARQHAEKNLLLSFRSLIVPAVNVGTTLGYILIVIGIIIALSQMIWVGIIFFSLSTLFSFLTLPIEINASSKGLQMIRELNLLERNEFDGAKKVLIAASLTYVAAAFASLSNLAYFVFQASRVTKRD